MRRIEAARLLREVPTVAEKIQEGALNLSQIGELSRSIKEKERSTGIKVTGLQKEELVFKIAGRTNLETQKELAQALDIPVKDFERQTMQKNESLRLELTLSKEQYQKLLACRDLTAHLLEQNQSDSSLASVFEVLADQYLAKKSPVGTKSRSTNENMNSRNSKSEYERKCIIKENGPLGRKHNSNFEVEIKPVPGLEFQCETEGKVKIDRNFTTASVLHSGNKTLTPKTRQLIFQRDTCCQYKDPQTGRQCRSTFGLQIDHRTSQWAGGNHGPENLQVLSRQHNRFKYRKEAGLLAIEAPYI